jgi:hypothetical protein
MRYRPTLVMGQPEQYRPTRSIKSQRQKLQVLLRFDAICVHHRLTRFGNLRGSCRAWTVVLGAAVVAVVVGTGVVLAGAKGDPWG